MAAMSRPPGTRRSPQPRGTRPVRATVRRLVVTLVMAGALAAGAAPVSATEPFTLHASLFDGCVTLVGAQNSLASVAQIAESGETLQVMTVGSGPNGIANGCFTEPVAAGMRIWVNQNAVTRTITIPSLTMKIDRVGDVVSGHAPAGTKVSIQVTHWITLGSGASYAKTPIANSKGAWTADFTSKINFIGGDLVTSSMINAKGDTFALTAYAPRLVVQAGTSKLSGTLLPGGHTTAVLKSSTGVTRATAYLSSVDAETDATGLFMKAGGAAATVRTGDVVTAPFATDARVKVVPFTIVADAASDHISGSCPAGRQMLVMAYHGSSSSGGYLQCSSTGNFALDLSATYDFASGDLVKVTTRQASGDELVRIAHVP